MWVRVSGGGSEGEGLSLDHMSVSSDRSQG